MIESYYDNLSTPYGLIFFLLCIPPFTFYRGLWVLSRAVSYAGPGLKISEVAEKGMLKVWIFFIVQWVIFFVLALYLEEVLKTGYGVKRHPLFFLKKVLCFQ